MKIVLTKTTKVTLKGSNCNKLIYANGEVVEVLEKDGRMLIKQGLATNQLHNTFTKNKDTEISKSEDIESEDIESEDIESEDIDLLGVDK